MAPTFFQKKSNNLSTYGRGPTGQEQLIAAATDKSWTVLNCHLLNDQATKSNNTLRIMVNALKAGLQTYGPTSDKLPSLRNNTGEQVKGCVFHGHVHNNTGTTYILEWTIIDRSNRILALTRFDTHENFKFKKKPLSDLEKERILSSTQNLHYMQRYTQYIEFTKNKLQKTESNHKNTSLLP